jgi:hypothetical protein
MVWHEIFAIFGAVITGAVLVSALSPKAKTNDILYTSWNGASGLVDTITAPVRQQAA